MDPKVTVAGAIGAGVGALQTPLIRVYVDPTYGSVIPQLGTFGTPSALAGMIGGGSAIAIGALGMTRGRNGMQRLSDKVIEPAIDYGVTAFVGGFMSGLFPCGAGGPGLQTATSYTYKPPLITSQSYVPPAHTQAPAVDMNVVKQMSAEIQRLNQENATLKSQAMSPAIQVEQIIPGPVHQKQERYGFMSGLETSQPLKRTEAIRKRYDFMG